MLRFSANLSMLFTELPLLQRIAAARQAGFDCIEIQFPYDVPLTELQQAVTAAGVGIALINVPAGDLMQGGDGLACVPGKEREFAAAAEQAVEYAHGLQVPQVNVLAGRVAPEVTRAQALTTLSANLQLAVPRLAAAGIGTTIEAINHFDMPRFAVNSAADMLQLLQQVNLPTLTMQVDLYHMARMGEDLQQLLRQHWQRIGHIQFADAPGRGAPGSGELPWATLFRLIGELPYAGYCGAEYKPGSNTEATLGWLDQYRG